MPVILLLFFLACDILPVADLLPIYSTLNSCHATNGNKNTLNRKKENKWWRYNHSSYINVLFSSFSALYSLRVLPLRSQPKIERHCGLLLRAGAWTKPMLLHVCVSRHNAMMFSAWKYYAGSEVTYTSVFFQTTDNRCCATGRLSSIQAPAIDASTYTIAIHDYVVTTSHCKLKGDCKKRKQLCDANVVSSVRSQSSNKISFPPLLIW